MGFLQMKIENMGFENLEKPHNFKKMRKFEKIMGFLQIKLRFTNEKTP